MQALTLHNDVGEMTLLAPFIEESCDAFGVSPDIAFQLQLVLDEAVANVVNYAYSESGQEFQVTIDKVDAQLVVQVVDHGIPFDPTQDSVAPDITLSVEERPIGGLGIFLIKEMMDEVEYQRQGDSNILTMKKNIG